jgi:hemerythrin-like domain-containing protein
MMGLAEKEKSDLRQRLPDYHILRKVMAEHEVVRCFLADLEEVADRISQASHLTSTSVEIMRLSHLAEHLSSLEEHIGREDDVLFPALKDRGWKSLLKPLESEHTYVQMAIDDLIKLIVVFDTLPLNSFKIRLMSTVRYLCPLLREHIFHEDRVLFPLAISMMEDEGLWEHLRQVCNEIGYCGIHL